MILISSARNIPKGGMTKKARIELGLRQCPDLGLWVIDNGVQNCKFKTPACKDCYNLKCTYYKNMKAAWSAGGKDDQCWNKAMAGAFAGLNRVRLNTRGEAFSSYDNVEKVAAWLQGNPNTKFWMVTRAHQLGNRGNMQPNWGMMDAIEQNIMVQPNAYVMASLDAWTVQHWDHLRDRKWSTIYYEKKNTPPPWLHDVRANVHKCRKTWTSVPSPKTGRPIHPKAVCKTCRNGCYGKERVDVWLKYHQ